MHLLEHESNIRVHAVLRPHCQFLERKIRNSPHRKNRQLSTGNETIFLASYFTNYIRHCLE